jgi:phosphatidylinositol alpha-1,6-mannosyltransferase
VERLVREHHLERDVVLAGRVPWEETPAYYDAGDVFAMPTRTRLLGLEPEALGICYLEAAATGLPVVAGDSGGAPDAVLDGENGFVVDGRDVAQVAERCSRLLLDGDLAARFGERGRAWVAQRWRWDDLALRLHRILAGEPAGDLAV